MFARASLAALACLALAAPAGAMNMRNHFEILALSEDGGSVLVRNVLRGPEGGGATSYAVWSATAPHRKEFALSDTLSAGAGATPEKISAADCATSAKALTALVKARGFKGVTVRADRCGKRDQVVAVEARHAKILEAAQFRAKGNKLQHDGVEVRFHNGEIAVFRDEQKQCFFQQPKREMPAEIHVWGGAGNKLVFVIESTSSGDEGLLGMCGVGEDGKLKLLPTTAEK